MYVCERIVFDRLEHLRDEEERIKFYFCDHVLGDQALKLCMERKGYPCIGTFMILIRFAGTQASEQASITHTCIAHIWSCTKSFFSSHRRILGKELDYIQSTV